MTIAGEDAESLHLADRVASLRIELDRLDGLLAQVEEKWSDPNGRVELRRIRTVLEGEVDKSLRPLREQLEALSGATRQQWLTVVEIATKLQNLAAELLPVAHGALARAAGLDNGLCALAEDLVADLAGSTVPGLRVVVPAAQEHTSARRWVIGMALREDSIWSLPIVAHEFAHVVGLDLKDEYRRRLAENLINGSWRDFPGLPPEALTVPGPLPAGRATELFADIFAAFCTGPAYAAELMARSVPVAPWEPQGTHPGFGARLRSVLAVFGETSLEWMAGMVRSEWEASLEAVGDVEEPSVAVSAAVDAFTARGIEVMELAAPRAGFQGEAVLDVGERLRRGEAPVATDDVRTVLNAAWEERLRDHAKVGTIEVAVRRWMTTRRAVVGSRQ